MNRNFLVYILKKATARILVVVIATISAISVSAQKNNLDVISQQFSDYRSKNLQEKIFTHLDRNFYVAGENMWFKLYCVDAYLHRPLDVSKVAYLEILDHDNKAIAQTKVSLQDGTGNGQIFLPVSLTAGNYLVRVYTAWMKNFSPDFYSQQIITIVNTVRKTEVVKNIKPQYEIQLFPEGGHLVDGLVSTVAFRIVDETGKGKNINGAIVNQHNDTIAKLHPLKFGIGKFAITPSAVESYRAVISDRTVSVTSKFPSVEKTGYVLNVTDTTGDQLKVKVRSKGIDETHNTIYLFAHTRQVVKIAEMKFLANGSSTFLVPKNKLGEGISHLTLFNDANQPIAERLYFKRPETKLSLSVQSEEAAYASRKKIKLSVKVATPSFQSGNFSMSVFKEDGLNQFAPLDIQQYEFLISDLRGTIESPDYYFSNDASVDQATDNLMLTHGWSRFKWNDLLSNKNTPLPFMPEYRGHIITGEVVDISSGLPVPGIKTFLSSPGKNVHLNGSVSDANGKIQFEMRDFYDRKKILIQPDLSRDSIYQVRINNPYSEVFSSSPLRSLTYTSAWKDQLTARSLSMQTENAYYGSKRIVSKLPTIDSTVFYGAADEKYLLDDYTRFPVMEEVLREYVPGVWVRKRDGKFIFKVPDQPHHGLFQNESLVLLDGVPISDIDKIMNFSPLKVQKLDVMTRKYFLGPFTFEGIVSFITYKGDLGGFELDPKVTVLDYQGLQLQKEFFSPHYDTPAQLESRLADRRNLLFWSPSVNLKAQETQQIEFFSSDEPGKYKVFIQGMDKNGVTGSATTSFEVTGPLNN